MGGLGGFLRNQSTEALIVGLKERGGRLAGALLDVFDGANCLPSAEAGGGEFSVKPFRSDTKRPSPGTKGFREVLLLFAPVVVVVVVDHVDCQKFVDGATSRSPE